MELITIPPLARTMKVNSLIVPYYYNETELIKGPSTITGIMISDQHAVGLTDDSIEAQWPSEGSPRVQDYKLDLSCRWSMSGFSCSLLFSFFFWGRGGAKGPS